MDTTAEPRHTRTASTEELAGFRDLDRHDTPWLLERYAATGDASYADAVIEIHRPLAISRARKIARPEVELEDLVQVAMEAMWKAVKRFRPDGGAAFSTFAVRTMDGELKRHYRDRVWSMRVPRGLKNLSLRVTRARRRYVAEQDAEPNVAELAAFAELNEDDVIRGLDAAQAYTSNSLDKPIGESATTVGDLLPDEAPSVDRERLLDVFERLKDLPKRQRRIVYLRFYKDLTQREIAERVGCSQMHVSRLLRKALGTVREELAQELDVTA